MNIDYFVWRNHNDSLNPNFFEAYFDCFLTLQASVPMFKYMWMHFTNTLLKSDVTRRDHVSVVMDPMNAGSRIVNFIVNFIRDGTVFA